MKFLDLKYDCSFKPCIVINGRKYYYLLPVVRMIFPEFLEFQWEEWDTPVEKNSGFIVICMNNILRIDGSECDLSKCKNKEDIDIMLSNVTKKIARFMFFNYISLN